MARGYRYVNDHGDLFRMTETKFRRYLLAGTNEQWPDAAKFGVSVGNVTTVTHFKADDFNEAFNEIHRAELLERDRLVLSVACPTCDAEIGFACWRTGARFERVYASGTGASTRDRQRKVPHDGRARAAERAQHAAKGAP